MKHDNTSRGAFIITRSTMLYHFAPPHFAFTQVIPICRLLPLASFIASSTTLLERPSTACLPRFTIEADSMLLSTYFQRACRLSPRRRHALTDASKLFTLMQREHASRHEAGGDNARAEALSCADAIYGTTPSNIHT